jgi:hypothetical protein
MTPEVVPLPDQVCPQLRRRGKAVNWFLFTVSPVERNKGYARAGKLTAVAALNHGLTSSPHYLEF